MDGSRNVPNFDVLFPADSVYFAGFQRGDVLMASVCHTAVNKMVYICSPGGVPRGLSSLVRAARWAHSSLKIPAGPQAFPKDTEVLGLLQTARICCLQMASALRPIPSLSNGLSHLALLCLSQHSPSNEI